MKVFILTRNKMKDYQFLGDHPEDRWWLNYQDFTSFENPTVIVETNSFISWRLYLSGVLSSRIDKVNTPIRYTFVIEKKNVIEQSLNQLLNFIDLCLQSFFNVEKQESLKKILDELLSEQELDKYFKDVSTIDNSKKYNEDFSSNFQGKFVKWLDLFGSDDMSASNEYNSWLGAIQNTKARHGFLNQVKKIINSKKMDKQIAAYLNFIECKQDLENTFLTEEEFKSVVVLVNNPNLLEIEEVCVKKKQQNMLPQTHTKPQQRTSLNWIWITVTLMFGML